MIGPRGSRFFIPLAAFDRTAEGAVSRVRFAALFAALVLRRADDAAGAVRVFGASTTTDGKVCCAKTALSGTLPTMMSDAEASAR